MKRLVFIASFVFLSVIVVLIGLVVFGLRGGDTESEPLVSFAVNSSPKNCAAAEDKVWGMQSSPSTQARLVAKFLHAKRDRLHAYEQSGTSQRVHLAYTIEDRVRTEKAEIQDVSFTLPQGFHDRETYELACRSVVQGGDLSDADLIVFRKLSPKRHNQNYEEPATKLLPRGCLGSRGEVVVKAKGYDDPKALALELKASVFRAVLWDASAKKPNPRALDLFLPRSSYQRGETMEFYAHATDDSAPVRLEIVHTGSDEPWLSLDDIRLRTQKVSAYSYRDGVDWPVAFSVDVPADAPKGYHVAVLRQNDKVTMFPLVISPPVIKSKGDGDGANAATAAGEVAPIAVIAATNTWQAYNAWGDGSFYFNAIGDECLRTDYARVISTQRPTDHTDLLVPARLFNHRFKVERMMAQWFDANGIDYVVYSDDDVHQNPALLDKHPIVLLPSHSEYPTRQFFDAIERHAARGGHILSLGGNTLYYKVTAGDDHIEKHEDGRLHDFGGGFGGTWASLGRSPAELLGVEYDARDNATFAPYKVLKPDHPAFEGTGLAKGDVFADNGSGHEMDVVNDFSPKNVTVLAKGTNANGYGADMVIYDHPAGGIVFSAGSISFSFALAENEKTGILVKNIIKMMMDKTAQSSGQPAGQSITE